MYETEVKEPHIAEAAHYAERIIAEWTPLEQNEIVKEILQRVKNNHFEAVKKVEKDLEHIRLMLEQLQ